MAKPKTAGVPLVWIKMTKQSYSGVQHDRRPDGSLRWMHKVLKGYDENKIAQYEDAEDIGHKDPKSYLRTTGVVEMPGDKPFRLHADIAAGLIATQQAEWLDEKNDEEGHEFSEIMDQFCPEHAKAGYESMQQAVA